MLIVLYKNLDIISSEVKLTKFKTFVCGIVSKQCSNVPSALPL